MNSKILIALAFLLVAAAQIYTPAEMINGREAVIANGKMFKFNTEPVDPADVMRGRYINLYFRENKLELDGKNSYINGQDAYIVLEEDENGYAKISKLSKEKPAETTDYLKIKIGNVVPNENPTSVFIDYPFDRFYMEENKAPKAEKLYNDSRLHSAKPTYAIVMVLDGVGVLTDVLIDDRPIRELVEEMTK
jgi:uncharacterized membrane-anchored protein